jgi:hypothetical protein
MTRSYGACKPRAACSAPANGVAAARTGGGASNNERSGRPVTRWVLTDVADHACELFLATPLAVREALHLSAGPAGQWSSARRARGAGSRAAAARRSPGCRRTRATEDSLRGLVAVSVDAPAHDKPTQQRSTGQMPCAKSRPRSDVHASPSLAARFDRTTRRPSRDRDRGRGRQ